MLINALLLAIPMAALWMLLTSQFNIGGLILGYAISLTLIWALRLNRFATPKTINMPGQVAAFAVYCGRLFIDILIAGVTVTRMILSPQMPIKPGIIELESATDSEAIAALSAQAITVTPGEMVVEFDGPQIMYVHSLNVDKSAESLLPDQRRRLRLLNRIFNVREAKP